MSLLDDEDDDNTDAVYVHSVPLDLKWFNATPSFNSIFGEDMCNNEESDTDEMLNNFDMRG